MQNGFAQKHRGWRDSRRTSDPLEPTEGTAIDATSIKSPDSMVWVMVLILDSYLQSYSESKERSKGRAHCTTPGARKRLVSLSSNQSHSTPLVGGVKAVAPVVAKQPSMREAVPVSGSNHHATAGRDKC